MNKKQRELLEEAADLAHSVWEDDRETGWCQDIEALIREALK